MRAPAADKLGRIEAGIVTIQEAANLAAEIALPKAGRPTPLHNIEAVISLCAIYEAATGLKPTRRLKAKEPGGTGVTYGPFHEFVIAALTLLEGKAATKGIDERIKRALVARKRT